MANTCKYDGCKYNVLVGQEYCVFHTPREMKSISDTEFNDLIFAQLNNRNCDFAGYVFPNAISFRGRAFAEKASFKGALFHGSANFGGTSFSGAVDFDNTRFEGGVSFGGTIFKCKASFTGTKFSGEMEYELFGKVCVNFSDVEFQENVDFREAHFSGANTSCLRAKFGGGYSRFINCRFTSGWTNFLYANFSGGDVSFYESKFTGGGVDFANCQFTGGDVSFIQTEFTGGFARFSRSTFAGDVKFRNNEISYGIDFRDIHLEQTASFFFTDPIFKKTSKVVPRIFFRHVSFNPFATFFQNIHEGEDFTDEPDIAKPIILFRYCNLKDVYFSNNNMSLFSFYRSAFFEESHITASEWTPGNHLICEDLLYREKREQPSGVANKVSAEGTEEVDFPKDLGEIADLYRRMKAAADRAKDYHLAGHLYFNEFEMKRLHIIEKAQESGNWLKRILKLLFSGRLWLYNFYKFFAGYGEKPLRSFISLLFFILVFSVLHLYNGIKVPDESNGTKEIHWNWKSTFSGPAEFWTDLPNALVFTIYRATPVSYLPYDRDKYGLLHHDFFWDIALSLANSIVLILMIIFIGIGLKRHFRRF